MRRGGGRAPGLTLTIWLVKLNNQLVMKRAPARPDSRDRLLAAAAAEFAARGFDGASVDRIARAARVNKAMIYYHFRNKAALYAEIFQAFIRAVLDRARKAAASPVDPADKIRAFIRALAEEAAARPHFPPMWLREIAGGGRHVDRATLDLIAQIPVTLGGIVAEGRAQGRFRLVHPLLLHFGIVGPLILFFVSQPVRERITVPAVRAVPLALEDALAEIERATLAALAPDAPGEPAGRPQGR